MSRHAGAVGSIVSGGGGVGGIVSGGGGDGVPDKEQRSVTNECFENKPLVKQSIHFITGDVIKGKFIEV